MWCYEIIVLQGVSGLRKKAGCDEDFLLIHICHFYPNLWENILFSPTANFTVLAFALQEIPLKPQIRCNIDMLIISCSPRQQKRCRQRRKRNIFWPLYISRTGNFSYQWSAFRKGILVLKRTKPYPVLSSAMRWTKDTQAFCSSQWVVLVHPIQSGL